MTDFKPKDLERFRTLYRVLQRRRDEVQHRITEIQTQRQEMRDQENRLSSEVTRLIQERGHLDESLAKLTIAVKDKR